MFIMPIKELALEAYPVKYIDEKSYERKNPDKNYPMRKAFEEGAVSVLTELTKELQNCLKSCDNTLSQPLSQPLSHL